MADCVRNTIDSNVVGLSFAETICGRLPTIEDDGYLPTWYELEPNSYSSFGGALTTMARTPINASRQRKKGTVVDLDAGAGFQQDWTQNNFDRLLQGFFFADWREKANTRPMNGDAIILSAVDGGTGEITGGTGLGIFPVGALVKTSGFTTAANNGTFTVTATTDTTVTLDGPLTTEVPPAAAAIEMVGFGFAAGGLSLTATGNIGTLEIEGAAPVAATGTLTIADLGNADAGDTVTVGSVTYEFIAGTPAAEYQIPIGADNLETAANFAAAINGGVMLSDAHPKVEATDNADGTVTLTAIDAGVTGNLIETIANGADLSFAAGTLGGGTGVTFTGLGLISGEWIFLGGDDADTFFPDNVGYARIGQMTATTLQLDKTTFAPSTVAAGALTINMYMGNVIKNEREADLIVTKQYEFRRTVGRDADGVQSEYVEAAVASELTLNIPVTDKATADIAYIAADKRNRTGAQGLKPGVTMAALGQDAINTSTDVYRIRMALVDETNSMPSPFFGYLSEYEIVINNNVSGVKGIGKIGNVDVSVGNFDVGGEATAFFTDMSGPNAIRANASVTVDAIFAKQNAGFIWDIPLLTVGGGEITVTPNEPVTIPLEQMGAENDYGYTLLYMTFPYLPNSAMPDQED